MRRIVEGETKMSKVSSDVSKLGGGNGKSATAGNGAASSAAPAALPPVSPADVKADDLRQMFLAMTEEVKTIAFIVMSLIMLLSNSLASHYEAARLFLRRHFCGGRGLQTEF